MDHELLCRIALTQVPNIGPVQAKLLVTHFGDAKSIFKASKKELENIEGIGAVKAASIRSFDNFGVAEKEIVFIEKHKIQPLFLTDVDYPRRLLQCYDSPVMLYYKGNADLNAGKIVSIIGTRSNTDYGRQLTEQIVEGLQHVQATIVSGLAYGIDAIAHKAALQHDLPTVGVLAHGLDKMYPPQHSALARQMVQSGGLLTEFGQEVAPDKHNFPRRNRIVAGMCDATIVIETAAKGGSMITAELANSYNRDVFAVPGKVTDAKSSGCNELIKANKAILLTNVNDLIETMGWLEKKTKPKKQRELFVQLTAEEQLLYDLLKDTDSLHIDELYLKSGLTSSAVAAAMLNLEFQNIITSLPGKIYKAI